jgi:hypothetical protein
MVGLADEIDNAIGEVVKGLRARGYSWAEIGSRLGITRQAARPGRRPAAACPLRAPEMPPNRHHQPTVTTSSSL